MEPRRASIEGASRRGPSDQAAEVTRLLPVSQRTRHGDRLPGRPGGGACRHAARLRGQGGCPCRPAGALPAGDSACSGGSRSPGRTRSPDRPRNVRFRDTRRHVPSPGSGEWRRGVGTIRRQAGTGAPKPGDTPANVRVHRQPQVRSPLDRGSEQQCRNHLDRPGDRPYGARSHQPSAPLLVRSIGAEQPPRQRSLHRSD